MLKLGVLLGAFLVFSQASAEFCYNDVEDGPLLTNCNAKYGSFEVLQPELQSYVSAYIETSFEYLLMSTHFGNYEANREGFKGLYRKLSDKNWNKAIDIIKYITKRGGRMNFNQMPRLKRNTKERIIELNELNSLAKALDTEKQLADEAFYIHNLSQQQNKLDASVAHYLEEEFIEEQAESVRKLSGHTNDLKHLLGDRDASVSIYLFDEYIKSTL
ncbi:ferritin light chain isoform X2 [Diachasmimorpha longicaudata]|uniref:ferritin light chain isoform X2 n=1 Tax=Diachasmimorpha longicaudata TaxID=58733 RepID=UPI0030B8F273